MAKRFTSPIQHVQDNTAVDAANTSRATRELEQRTSYLREIIENSEAGRALVTYEQVLEADIASGHTVAWSAENDTFQLAVAAGQVSGNSGQVVLPEQARALGLCVEKTGPKTGTIALSGLIYLTPAQITNGLIDEGPGQYYLSGTQPGKLVKQRPALGTPVMYWLGAMSSCEDGGWGILAPQQKEFLEDHVHHQVELVAKPAGDHTPPASGGTHSITGADDSLQGWLPTDHASFNGLAPAGAEFGYNIAADDALTALWPPIPVGAVVLEMYRPSGEVFPLAGRVLPEYVQIDDNGIWWMSDCYGEVPWPTDYNGGSNSSSAACPIAEMRLILSFVKLTFLTDKSVVTSLQPAANEPIEFVNCKGDAATTGDLKARLKLEAFIEGTDTLGGVAFKSLAEDGFKFNTGWLTEGVIANNENIQITSSHQRLLDPSLPSGPSNPVVHQGVVRLTVLTSTSELELQPQLVFLGDALEREHKGVQYLGFPTNRTSSVRFRFDIPVAGLSADPQLKLRTNVFGRAAGVLSAMTMSYYRIARPTVSPFPVINGVYTPVPYDIVTPSDDIDGLGGDLTTDTVLEVESDEFDVAPGDTVFVTLSRDAAAEPTFAADIGLLRIVGVLLN